MNDDKDTTAGRILGFIFALVASIALRAVFVMFFAAVVHEQFGVWSPMGYLAALAWAGACSVVLELTKKSSSPLG